jgi:hypothetical protein
MSIRKLFGLEPATQAPSDGDTETVRRITAELEAMQSDKARYMAAFAFVLARVAPPTSTSAWKKLAAWKPS